MIIVRTINKQKVGIELTDEELLEACKQHFAKQNEEYIEGFVNEDEEFSKLSEEERKELIHNIAYDMVDYIQVDEGDYEVFYECSKGYRKDNDEEDED